MGGSLGRFSYRCSWCYLRVVDGQDHPRRLLVHNKPAPERSNPPCVGPAPAKPLFGGGGRWAFLLFTGFQSKKAHLPLPNGEAEKNYNGKVDWTVNLALG
jgi:hypothetical protein